MPNPGAAAATAPPLAVPAPIAPAAPAAPPPAAAHPFATPATQLVARLAPLREGPDGVHRLTMHLHPADLGPVQVVAELRAGMLHLELVGGNELARETLRGALSDLRRELTEAGVTAGDLDVRDEDARSPSQQAAAGDGRGAARHRRPDPSATGSPLGDPPATDPQLTSRPASAGRGVDVRV